LVLARNGVAVLLPSFGPERLHAVTRFSRHEKALMELVGKALSKAYSADLPSRLMMGSAAATRLIIPAKELIASYKD